MRRDFLRPDGTVVTVNFTPGAQQYAPPVPYWEARQDALDDVARLKGEADALRAVIDRPTTRLRERLDAEAKLGEVERRIAEAMRDPRSNPGAHAEQVTCTGSSRLAVSDSRASTTVLPCSACGQYHGTPRPTPRQGRSPRESSPSPRRPAEQAFMEPVPYHVKRRHHGGTGAGLRAAFTSCR